MATARQIVANRNNSQKCKGPRTPEGRAASSQNALKTGIHAKSEVIRSESREQYHQLIAEYYHRFQPAAPEERALVDDLIRAEWLGRRYILASTLIWEQGDADPESGNLGAAFLRNSSAICRAQRCINSTQRNFAAALKQLTALQAKRLAERMPDRPQPAANESVNRQLVSFRSLGIAIPERDPIPKQQWSTAA